LACCCVGLVAGAALAVWRVLAACVLLRRSCRRSCSRCLARVGRLRAVASVLSPELLSLFGVCWSLAWGWVGLVAGAALAVWRVLAACVLLRRSCRRSCSRSLPRARRLRAVALVLSPELLSLFGVCWSLACCCVGLVAGAALAVWRVLVA